MDSAALFGGICSGRTQSSASHGLQEGEADAVAPLEGEARQESVESATVERRQSLKPLRVARNNYAALSPPPPPPPAHSGQSLFHSNCNALHLLVV